MVEELFPIEETHLEHDFSCKILSYKHPPQQIREFFSVQKAGILNPIAIDQVMDAELIIGAKQSTSPRETIEFKD